MDITITLPEHVAAAFEDEAEAVAFALGALTAHAREQALAVANDEAQALLRQASAPFDGGEAPVTKTVPERVAEVEGDQSALRAQVRAVGVTLATAAGVPESDAVAMIEAALSV